MFWYLLPSMDLLGIIAIILSIIALHKISNIEKRISGKSLPAPTSPPSPQQITTQNDVKIPDSEASQVTSSKDHLKEFIAWYVHEWPLKTGALLVLFGFIWFVSYAFLNNWIGPFGRIFLGFVVGAGILLLSEFRIRSYKTQGTTLCWLGSAIILVTIYAAHTIYGMFSSNVSLAFVFLTMIMTTTFSLRHNRYSLAIATLLIATFTPYLINSGNISILGLYSYLLVIVLGTLWVVKFTGWKSLILVALTMVTAHSAEFLFASQRTLFSHNTPIEILQLRSFAVIFVVIFYFASLVGIAFSKKTDRIDIVTAGLVGFFTLAWIRALTPEHLKSIETVMVALSYAVGAYIVYVKSHIKNAVYVYTGVSIVMLVAATMFEFSGPALTVALAAQALVIPLIILSLLGSKASEVSFLYFFLPAITSLDTVNFSKWDSFFQNDFYKLSALSVCLLVSGMYIYYKKLENKSKNIHDISISLIIAGSVVLYFIIWKEAHVLIPSDDAARMLALVIYTCIGLTAYIMGQMQNRHVLYVYGIVLLVAVIGRLLLFEVWNMALVGRTVTFILIGSLLIGSVLLRKNTKTT